MHTINTHACPHFLAMPYSHCYGWELDWSGYSGFGLEQSVYFGRLMGRCFRPMRDETRQSLLVVSNRLWMKFYKRQGGRLNRPIIWSILKSYTFRNNRLLAEVGSEPSQGMLNVPSFIPTSNDCTHAVPPSNSRQSSINANTVNQLIDQINQPYAVGALYNSCPESAFVLGPGRSPIPPKLVKKMFLSWI